MTPHDAYRHCQDALDTGDGWAAEYWLYVFGHLLAEAEDRRIARAVRDAELYAMAQLIEWEWIE
jgi:hypothetical protein